jgi:hypothetical protein
MLYYGPFCVGQTHGHSDKLALALFAQGREWVEEIGRTDGYLLPVYAGWSQSSASHAVVAVDARRQEPNAGGRLLHSYHGPRVSVADASAEDAYPGRVSLYRRCVALLRDPADGAAYALDIFRVRGGSRHEYSLHASASHFGVEGLALSDRGAGTLAGPEVAFGDPTGFDPQAIMGYRGPGYQFLAAPASGRPPGPWRALWRDGRRSLAACLPGGNEAIVAEGRRFHEERNGARDLFTYLIVRREGKEGLSSDFVAALEVFGANAAVRSIRLLDAGGDTVSCAVSREGAEDFYLHDLDPRVDRWAGPLCVRGTFGCATMRGRNADMLFILDGSIGAAAGVRLELGPGPLGTVLSVDPAVGEILVRWSSPILPTAALAGCKLHIERSGDGATDYEIASFDGDRVRVRGASLVYSTGVVDAYDADGRVVVTRSPLLKLATPGPQSRGTALACEGWNAPVGFTFDSGFKNHGQTESVFRLVLIGEPERKPVPGEPFTVLCASPGDRVRVPSYGCLERTGESRYRLSANVDARVALAAPPGARVWARAGGGWVDCGDASGASIPAARCHPACELAVSAGAPG